MSSNRPSPGFRLNAPQADSEVEQMGDHSSGAFGGLGDELEDRAVLSNSLREQPTNGMGAKLNQDHYPTHQQQQNQQQNQQQYQQQNQQHQNQQHQQQYPPPAESRGFPLKWLIAVGILVIVLLVGLIVAVIVTLGGDDDSQNLNQLAPVPAPTVDIQPTVPTLPPRPETSAPTEPPINQEPTPAPKTVLGRVYQRGYLLCGISDQQPGFSEINRETGIREGFDAEMCRAVAAAVFGDIENRVQYVGATGFNRFELLADGSFDVLIRTTTHTMQRQVLEATTGESFSFSVPYLYNGLQFAGEPINVECADNFTVAEDICADTVICALDGTTHVDEISALLPDVQIISVVGSEFLYTNFIQGFCNVIAGEQFDIAESIVRERGYVGEYAYGTKIHSKEPLAFVTRDDDPEWSDFVNWVLQALLGAEDEAITQRTANIIAPTTVFGETSPFALAFRNAVREVGNYGEIYRRTLEVLLPRPIPDRINEGDSGLIYSYPFGAIDGVVAAGPALGSTLDEIRTRGFLKCGISRRVIFAQFDTASQTWDGFDVDFCKAISAAIFNGTTSTIVYTDLPASERFVALQNGDVDLLSRLTTVTLSRDIREPATQAGFSFSQPNFYDGLTFGGIPPFAGCADRLDVTSISCRDLLICVNRGTTFESRLKNLFPERFIVSRQSGEFTVEGLVTGECNVIAGGVVDVSLTSIRTAGYDGPYQTGSSRYSKDPLALVTRQDDPQFSKFVYWIVASIFYAEESGIDQGNASLMPVVTLFGPLYFNMFINAVGAVGNYGEIYSRQAQSDVPRGGLNEINELLSGPQHYPLPGAV